jgi:hypothetical protein
LHFKFCILNFSDCFEPVITKVGGETVFAVNRRCDYIKRFALCGKMRFVSAASRSPRSTVSLKNLRARSPMQES